MAIPFRIGQARFEIPNMNHLIREVREENLMDRINRVVDESLQLRALDYQRDWIDLARIPLRVVRNITVSALAPIQFTLSLIFSPTHAFNRIRQAAFSLRSSLTQAQSVMALLIQFSVTAMTLSSAFGALPYASALFALCGSLFVLRAIWDNLAENRWPAALQWVESALTGWLTGRALAWMFARIFAPKISQLQEQMSQQHSLTPHTSAFVNSDGEAVLLYEGKQVPPFLQANQEVNNAFQVGLGRLVGDTPWQRTPFQPTFMVVGGQQGISTLGRTSRYGQAVIYEMSLRPGVHGRYGTPSLHLQNGLRSCVAATAIQAPGVACASQRPERA